MGDCEYRLVISVLSLSLVHKISLHCDGVVGSRMHFGDSVHIPR
jgi:hypothetical protein